MFGGQVSGPRTVTYFFWALLGTLWILMRGVKDLAEGQRLQGLRFVSVEICDCGLFLIVQGSLSLLHASWDHVH